MKICPMCYAAYSDDSEFCTTRIPGDPHDSECGSELVVPAEQDDEGLI